MKLTIPTRNHARWVWFYSLIMFVLLYQFQPAQAESDQPLLEPGLYQSQGGDSAARLKSANGAWEMGFWQGPAESEPGAGFAFFGRFLPRTGTARLTGTWQSLPGSCCPGRGRGEIEALDARSFRFAVFAPSLDQAPWSSLAKMVFTKVAELPAQNPLARLVGDWRIALWYNDLLPGGAPADLVSGHGRLTAGQGRAEGVWEGWPGELALTPQPGGLELTYKDPAAGYELSAALREEAGGLALEGPFASTLGRGRLRMVRAGLPADPGGPAASGGGDLAGLWVDPRTGNDFFQIKDSGQEFDFTAYGGSLNQPRYLSKGSARLAGPGRYEAVARDQEGYCCGNQARLVFRKLSPEEMEVSSIWWPAGQPDPGTPPTAPYLIKRAQRAVGGAGAPTAAEGGGGRWPYIQAAKPGLMARESGALKVAFSWQPVQSGGEQKAVYTLFSQGGYQRDLDLFIDHEGRLGASIATKAGMVTPKIQSPLKPGESHEAWLIYQAGGQAKLFLDGAQASAVDMLEPWVGSNSPYLVGASRWPGRTFQGVITQVNLYATAQDPAQAGEADLVITPPETTGASEAAGQASQASSATQALIRLWNPYRLVHAYAETTADLERLQNEGWQRKGPVAGLWSQAVPGSQPIYGFRHRGKGYTIMSTSQSPPAGCDALGLMGHILPQPAEGSVALYELKAELPEPLRGGSTTDLLYTTNPETVEAARRAGYGQERIVGYAQQAKEPPYSPPVLYSWSGAWRGEGWGRFLIKRQGHDLLMFWYYGPPDGPHYYGHYRLNPDLKRAEGIAVGRPGKGASYYRHVLEFIADVQKGPQIRLTSWRLAAPLDDGRLVRFVRPKPTVAILNKAADSLPAKEVAELAKALGPPDPATMLDQALKAAIREKRLLER
jgi:hypothetical protein